MNRPLVTIIMPVYNAELFLREAIDSVLAQDYSTWELLIVDDGSTDNSRSVAKSYNDSRISIMAQSNKGASNARNVALSVMKGDFLCFLDADDVLTSNSLSSRLACFHSDDISFADGAVEVFNSTMSIRERTWTPQQPQSLLKSLVRLDTKWFFGPTWFLRRKPLVAYQFDECLTHGEDLFFFMSYAHLGKYAFTRQIILKYRKSPNSAMQNMVGLANGYSLIRQKLGILRPRVSLVDRTAFSLRIRKIMFLIFINAGRSKSALKYLLLGHI